MGMKKQLLFTSILLGCGFLSQAQPAPKQPASLLLVNVLDRNGNALRDLTKDNFRVKVNGRPTALLAAYYGLAPRRIVVLLDMSGSMTGVKDDNKWRIAREAVDVLLAETRVDVPVALLTFSSEVRNRFDFSQGRPSVAAFLKQGPSQQSDNKPMKTALFDAVLAAAKLLEPARPGDTIYAITDGGDNSSHISETDTKKRLVESQIRLFVFLLAEPILTEEERSGAESLIKLARDTGGFVFGVASRPGAASTPAYDYNEQTRENIRLCTQALNIQVNGFYTLQLVVPVQPGKGGKVSLEIVDGSGKVRKDVALTYPRALPAQGK